MPKKLYALSQCMLLGHKTRALELFEIWELNNGLKTPKQVCQRCEQVRTPILKENPKDGFTWSKWGWED